jgi:hypothetical protein
MIFGMKFRNEENKFTEMKNIKLLPGGKKLAGNNHVFYYCNF